MKRSNPIQPILSLVSPIQPHLTHYLLPLAIFLLLAGMALAAAPTQAAAPSIWCESSAQTDIPAAECQALEALYQSTNGGSWFDKSGWLSSDAICTEWTGVACSSGQVSGLTLNSNHLDGTIPASLSDLTALTALDLNSNLLSGSIPSSLGTLSNLTALLLGGNLLEGSIPPDLGLLSNLEQLDLGDNKLSGPIPSELGGLTSLTIWLFLEGNQLEGPIPPEVCSLNPLVKNIDYNKLDISASSPAACDTTFPDWRLTQTVPPTSLSADEVIVNTVQGTANVTAEVTVSWLPIPYTADGGNFEVFTRHLTNNTIESRGTTADKTAGSLRVTIPGDPASFVYFVRTNTPAHDGNQNDLTSVDSEEVALSPVAIRMLDIRANTPLLYLPALAPLALLLLTGLATLTVFKQ